MWIVWISAFMNNPFHSLWFRVLFASKLVVCFCSLDPTQMGGLSMLLLAGEHALGTPEVSQALRL
jgi:hypothetical protein